MRIIVGINIFSAIDALRCAVVFFSLAALLCLAKVGPGWLAGGSAVLLAALAAKLNGHTMTRIDTTVQSWLSAHRSRGLQVDAGAAFAYLGQPLHFAVLVTFCGTVLSLHARSVQRAPLLLAVVGTGVAVEQILKAVIGRTAQPLALYSHAFPSGHVTVWGAFLGMVAVCVGTGRSQAVRAALAAVVSAAVLAVGFVAVYSGAHIFTDVIGGMVLSGLLVASGAAVLRASRPVVRLPRPGNLAADRTGKIRSAAAA